MTIESNRRINVNLENLKESLESVPDSSYVSWHKDLRTMIRVMIDDEWLIFYQLGKNKMKAYVRNELANRFNHSSAYISCNIYYNIIYTICHISYMYNTLMHAPRCS